MRKMLYIFYLFLLTGLILARQSIGPERYEYLSGVKKTKDIVINYNKGDDFSFDEKNPSKFLADNFNFIPMGSSVLDISMRDGRNSVFLARKGFRVTGLDLRQEMVEKSRSLAKRFGITINTIKSSLGKFHKKNSEKFDAIISFYHVDRKNIKKILSMLKDGGILIFEAYTLRQKSIKAFESYPEINMIKPEEMLSFFDGYRVLKYEEPEHTKDFTGSIIVRKRFKNKED